MTISNDNTMPLSKTKQAVILVQTQGKTVKEAAQELGIETPGIYRALSRLGKKIVCPCCGSVVDKHALYKDPQ